MSVDRMSFRAETSTLFTIRLRRLGVLYGFWATARFHLRLPERYRENLKIDGRFSKPFCVIRIGKRERAISIAQLAANRGWFRRNDGLKIWSWREAPLKAARQVILAALEKEKKSWDQERYSATDSGDGKAII